ncbi:BREX system P-loop protein BrxC [Segatella copri]|uniref:BREX system P-loop protein BrxC n=1 Tax=Segatella copri TaxID=165179 RepID=A0AAW5UZT2_9BACT|nr:BREX system P-loop protein BrxC [Segatella copri]MCW4141854.1 BREX system P-loop protein BrxC [Segatella copri]MCW4145788.1 BREX system P-loop protein BrxC [Segatella copri]MCW4165954.1 BREX system P-loop protein BrxC [Segatella copri]
MKLKDLYDKPIERPVNPAVSATKFDSKTIDTEIDEYVFTDEIINGLFRILDAIKNNKPYDHVGIWIDGYYGSGKSHFLKYLDYCITPATRERAVRRLLAAVKAIDPLDEKHNLSFDYDELLSIANWLKRATIDTCIFNLETSYDNSTDKKKAFLHVFWNEFNGKRGFNKFNITLAQNLEKPLAEKGVFEAFKERIAEEGGDWNDPGMAADLIDNELDWVLDIAKELAPTLSVDSIRERIIKRDTNMSIDRFGMELASYLKDKGDDYRLILLADEVSQFINKERDRYLNLQEIITKLSEACDNKVWVACTAQQDLSEIMDDCHIAEEKDKEGKIKGRFEVKVSLKGTQPEVITQKRILDKKEKVKPELAALYNKYKAGFDLQFKLPTSYSSYETQDDFVDYYPFVPYQFKLIMQVFNSFLNLGYVAKEVKGNERSIIKVIHSTAKTNADAELGKFISFDELYNNMFEEGLQARGQKAVDNALRMARTYQTDRPERTRLAVRVANVLFMICNISQTDQLVFPATLDNVTSLLINDMETPRLNIKNEVEKVIEFLCDNNIIRREQGKNGAPETYAFYSEEEMKVAQLIQSQVVDNNTQAEQLKEIFNRYITALRNKEQYKTRSFSVGLTIKQRTFLSNNPDVQVEFVMDADYETAEQLALQNSNVNRMVYYVGPQYRDNKRLYNAFYWYCQANRYMATPVTSEDNKKTRDEFEKRANELYDGLIKKEFEKILDTCPIISGLSVIDEAELGQKRGNDRYRVAMDKHLSSIYTKANLVDYPSMPRTTEQLKKAILRNVNPGDYDGMNAVLTDAEHEVEIYLNKQFAEVNVSDVLAKFAKAPYGWDNICTLYIINELVRRHNRDYSYANNPNVETSTVANRIVSESNKFTLRQAKVISPQVIQNFIAAWKEIFGISAVPSSTDSTQLFRACRDIESDRSLAKFIKGYKDIEQQIAGYQFCQPIREAIDLFESWLNERDPLKFFNLVIAAKDEAKVLIDKCKEVVQFTHDQLDTYKQLLQFLDDNQYNFPFVPMEMQGAVTDFNKLKNDPWPISGLRGYIKLQRQLSGILDGVRDELREKIKAAYNDMFDYLKQVAEKQHVPESVLSDRETVIRVKTTPTNILVLQNNANTDTFYQEQVDKIMSYNPPLPPGGEGDGKPEPPKTPDKRIRKASLQTKTKLPITNSEDIERYLEGLRQQLEKLLVDQDGVMIVK